MRKYIVILFCLFICLSIEGQARTVSPTRNNATLLGENAQIFVLTCTPGTEVWSKYGHTGIRVLDPENDIDIVFSFVEKTIKQFKEENGADQPLLPMYKDEADKTFAFKLLDSVLLHNNEIENIITKYLVDWDIDRVAKMDLVILKAAIAELLYFSTIPVNVTLDEYIELAKYYGTKKSSKFINGVLDKVVQDLRETSELSKFKISNKKTKSKASSELKETESNTETEETENN